MLGWKRRIDDAEVPLSPSDRDSMRPALVAPLRDISLGMAWASSSVNCKTYAAEGLVSADGCSFGAFFDAQGALAVYRVEEDSGSIAVRRFVRDRMPHDAHDTPSLNLDSTGRLHVFSSAHVSRPTYLRSEPGADLDTIKDCSGELPDCLDAISYPSLVQAPGQTDLLLLYRAGFPANSSWNILRSAAGSPWSETPECIVQGRLGPGATIGPYLNLPLLFDDGRIGLAVVWRSTAVEGGRANPLNRGIYYAELNPGARSMHSAAGLALPLPLSPLLAECAWPVGWGADLTNQAGACLEGGKRPVLVSAWRSSTGRRQIHLLRQDSGGGWFSRAVASFSGDFRLTGNGTLATPESRPVVVPIGDRAIAVIYRTSRNDGQLVAHVQPCASRNPTAGHKVVLIDGGLDQYEPVAERIQSGNDGRLRMYVQRTAQRNNGDKPEKPVAAEARLMIWDLSDVLGPIDIPSLDPE